VIPESLADFWTEPRTATLGTARHDGSVHLVPVHAMRDGDELLVLTHLSSVKVRNVELTGHASLTEHTRTGWATVEGPARVSKDADDLARARAAYHARHGRPSWFGDCVIVVTAERVLHAT
jgi:predicted pyridoxine 5'-phosphate oxidase superfamily flavin-nucleotide-binding protein